MSMMPEILALKNAVADVKHYLDAMEVGLPPNDMIINGIEDRGDLWIFYWNNGWPLVGNRYYEYPGCSPLVVFKEDGRLLPLSHDVTWGDAGLDGELANVRRRWRETNGPT